MRMLRLLPVALFALAACSDGDKDLAAPDNCNPLGTSACYAPWPSSAFEVADSTTATGRRVAIPKGALPTNIDGVLIESDPFNTLDGWSSAAPMVIAFDSGIDGANLVHYSNYAASTTDASPTGTSPSRCAIRARVIGKRRIAASNSVHMTFCAISG